MLLRIKQGRPGLPGEVHSTSKVAILLQGEQSALLPRPSLWLAGPWATSSPGHHPTCLPYVLLIRFFLPVSLATR